MSVFLFCLRRVGAGVRLGVAGGGSRVVAVQLVFGGVLRVVCPFLFLFRACFSFCLPRGRLGWWRSSVCFSLLAPRSVLGSVVRWRLGAFRRLRRVRPAVPSLGAVLPFVRLPLVAVAPLGVLPCLGAAFGRRGLVFSRSPFAWLSVVGARRLVPLLSAFRSVLVGFAHRNRTYIKHFIIRKEKKT